MLCSIAVIADPCLEDNGMQSGEQVQTFPHEKHLSLDDIIAIFTETTIYNAIRERKDLKLPYLAAASGHRLNPAQHRVLPPEAALRYEMFRRHFLPQLTGNNMRLLGICTNAVDILEAVHNDMLVEALLNGNHESNNIEPAALVRFFSFVPPEFVSLLREREIAALVILEDFIELFSMVDRRWFLRNWVSNALDIVRASIGPHGANRLAQLKRV